MFGTKKKKSQPFPIVIPGDQSCADAFEGNFIAEKFDFDFSVSDCEDKQEIEEGKVAAMLKDKKSSNVFAIHEKSSIDTQTNPITIGVECLKPCSTQLNSTVKSQTGRLVHAFRTVTDDVQKNDDKYGSQRGGTTVSGVDYISKNLLNVKGMILICLLDGKNYGVGIENALNKEIYPEKVSTSNVYTALGDLEKEGLIESKAELPELAVRGGRKRYYYSLTSLGLAMTNAIIRDMNSTLEQLRTSLFLMENRFNEIAKSTNAHR